MELISLFLSCLAIAAPSHPSPQRYDIACDLNPDSNKLRISATVPLTAEAITAGSCSFTLAKLMDQPSAELITGNTATPISLKASSQSGDTTYEFKLPSGAKRSSKLKLTYENHAKDSFVFHIGPEGSFAGGYNTTWYPVFGDSRAVGKMAFEVPTGYVVKATGKELSATNTGDGKRYVFEIKNPCVFTFAAAKYVVKRIEGKVPMTLYLLHDRANAGDYTTGCTKILGILEGMYGPYPYPDFSIIETPAPISSEDGFSGASFEGFMFGDSNALNAAFSYAYFGHEMGHQWWGNLVHATEGKGADLLDEAMAQYGSLQVVEAIQGPQVAAQYRATGYPGYSPSQSGRGAVMASVTEFDLILGLNEKADGVTHELADEKGFLVWDALSRRMGRENFHLALREIAKKYAWGTISLEEFLSTLRTHSKVDIGPDIDQWLYRKGVPCLSLNWHQSGDKLTVSITQTEPAYRLEVPVEVEFAGGQKERRMVGSDGTVTDAEFKFAKQVLDVKLDPDFEVLHATPDTLRLAHEATYATRTLFLILSGDFKGAQSVCKDGLAHLPKPDSGGVELKLRFMQRYIDQRLGKGTGAGQ